MIANIAVTIVPPDVDEQSIVDTNPRTRVLKIAQLKAKAVSSKVHNDAVIIAGDSFTVCQNQILEKPKDISEGIKMLEFLSGKQSTFYTASVMINTKTGEHQEQVIESNYWFRRLDKSEIINYVNSLDVTKYAGAFTPMNSAAISFITKLEGSLTAFTHAVPMDIVVPTLRRWTLYKKRYMNKQEALEIVNSTTHNPNLVKHMLAVGAFMKELAHHFGENEELWETTGLVHDADYEMYKDDPKKHPSKIFEILEEHQAPSGMIQAVKAHAWGWREDLPEPQTKLDWSIFCGDELTGLVTAVTLVQPTRKLADVTVEAVMKKWNKKDFAKGVIRENVALCEEKLGLPLREFIALCIQAMQGISDDLGL